MRRIPSLLDFDFLKGGQGSGNFGHAGRPGEKGGSAPGESKPKDPVDPYTAQETIEVPVSPPPTKELIARLARDEFVHMDPDIEEHLVDYTGNDYAPINKFLRTNPAAIVDPNLAVPINAITKAIDSAKQFPTPLVVWRGLTLGEKGYDVIDKFEKNVGKTIQMSGFQSTSISPRKPVTSFTSNETDVLFRIHTRKGLAINGYSSAPNEDEVLLGHNWKYRVVSAKPVSFEIKYTYTLPNQKVDKRTRFVVDLEVEE